MGHTQITLLNHLPNVLMLTQKHTCSCLSWSIVHAVLSVSVYLVTLSSYTVGAHLRFIRKVDHGRIRTRCPIIDILCSVGCRLKMMMSPSHMCRSTCERKSNSVSNHKSKSGNQLLFSPLTLIASPCNQSAGEGHLVWGGIAGRCGRHCHG